MKSTWKLNKYKPVTTKCQPNIMHTKSSISFIFLIGLSECTTLVKECGIKKSLTRIVGGRDSGGYHYPWFALLVLKENVDFPFCAGSLITSRHVLTAAHCFTIKPWVPRELLFNILMGVYDRCNHNESTRKIFTVLHVDLHEEYNNNKKFHDIALITLTKSADFTVVCLPLSGIADATEPALLIGFGVTEQGGNKAPCHMMEAQVKKYSKRDCRNTKLPQEDVEEPSIICAGIISGGIDSCQGDSGGPLLIVTSNGRYVLTGIVSYGYGCANPGFPGLYTNVETYLDWIGNKIFKERLPKTHRNEQNFSSSILRKNDTKQHSSGSVIVFPENYPKNEGGETSYEHTSSTLKTYVTFQEKNKFVKSKKLPIPLGKDSNNGTNIIYFQNLNQKSSTVKFPENH